MNGAARRTGRCLALGVEGLEARALMAAPNVLTEAEVELLLQRAAAATASNDAIIAVVDRGGRPLGIRIESGVDPAITGNTDALVFAVDGALAKARTGAFFGNNQAPLTSRTIQLISQTTMTQREIESNPSIPDPDSTLRGPGFVAPIGIKGHFPPGVRFTPQVDLFAIEHTNRDSLIHPGPDRIKGTPDDIVLPSRFNVDPAFIPPNVQADPLFTPESYGFISGIEPDAQARGIATLPGGVPIAKKPVGGKLPEIVGGIGVFFPGKTGFATEENSQLNNAGFYDPTKRDRSQEAEFMAVSAVGGFFHTAYYVGNKPINGAPALPNSFGLVFGRIDLVGISLDLAGGHGLQGPGNLFRFGKTLGRGNPNDGVNIPVDRMGDTLLNGEPVPDGWLVTPHAGGGLTAEDVVEIVSSGIKEANRVRAAIRLPLDSTAKMVFSVNDKDGNILGLFRMPDATVFSIDVAVAKGRNVAYYADPAELQPQDQLRGVTPGAALTNRTFRYLALPRFPEGIDVYPPGPFSILTDGGVLHNGRNDGPPLPASAYQSAQGFDAFNPGTNFHDPFNVANQNGVVFFPGSAPLYKDTNGDGLKELVGGLGVSGDGVDQDDDVTFVAVKGFEPPGGLRADQFRVRGVRLPYIKFNRQPHVPGEQKMLPFDVFERLPRGTLRRRRT
jgi:uncharacterized protein GlcG (DUF336 family)